MHEQSPTQLAIDLLLELAEKGEIDPWNVDVIFVIDRFLSQLAGDDRQDLQASGQAILYGAMLVQLKAQTLAQSPKETQPDQPADASEDVVNHSSIDLRAPHLEKVLQRRPVPPPPPARPVTLAELIQQITAISHLVADKSPQPPKNPLRQPRHTKTSFTAIAQLAHEENLTETALALENYLSHHSHKVLEINDLCTALNDRVGVFWGLLLLSQQNKVEMWQSDFYGKIYVQSKSIGETIPLHPWEEVS